ncbi:MAG TPA: hypothetical protein VMB50_02620 [Myxococcales bacterium]|nr:hypothetical protein [Myxococcales bacterium]
MIKTIGLLALAAAFGACGGSSPGSSSTGGGSSQSSSSAGSSTAGTTSGGTGAGASSSSSGSGSTGGPATGSAAGSGSSGNGSSAGSASTGGSSTGTPTGSGSSTGTASGSSSGGTAGACGADGTPCGQGQVCTSGSCQTGCYIGGAFYVGAEADPANACQLCDPTSSTNSWTPETGLPPATGGCAAGQVCSAGACAAGCFIAGAVVAPGAAQPGNACESCQPALSVYAYSPATGLPPDGGCQAGEVCADGNCAPGCAIDGGFVASGAFEADAGCESCTPASDLTGWTPYSGVPPVGVCASEDECDRGACCAPSCTGKCPYADDGCGQPCPIPPGGYPGCTLAGQEGCCDPSGVCQPGSAASACTVGGACQNCTANSQSCSVTTPRACCTPGGGCGVSCGDPTLLDACGNPCPFNCPSSMCCDANLGCQPGTSDTDCGKGGTLGSCVSCNTVSCDASQACGVCKDGAMTTVTCGSCMERTSTCVKGEWVAGACSSCPPGIICTAGVCGS